MLIATAGCTPQHQYGGAPGAASSRKAAHNLTGEGADLHITNCDACSPAATVSSRVDHAAANKFCHYAEKIHNLQKTQSGD